MQTYGSTLKRIRKYKSLSQKYVSAGWVNRTSLSKIETNDTIPSMHTLIGLIEKLDVSLDEFEYIRNNYQLSNKQQILTNFFSLVSNFDLKAIHRVINHCDIYLINNPNDILVKEIHSICIASTYLANNKYYEAQKIITTVWKRLEQVEQYTVTEINLVCNILFFFPEEVISKFTPRLLIMINRYLDFDKSLYSLKISLLINSALLLRKSDLDTSLAHLKEAIPISKQINRYDLLAIAQFSLGSLTSNFTMIEQARHIFFAIDQKQMFYHLEKELKA
ncbi:helix-turn-helix domain-containing protein [Listeria seeligeri]|uniref:helix-turn-helix domain-containing protein n=1 Tax=Listeria seeligeri TaxID=1640 RepID=UPI00162AEA20|nr:helix-turn-helix transcriptional regulator [Listeria seeligeri]MBC1584605.1 helix-turn-helix transcriptional regulator [Listeria seeligeri]